MPVIIQIMAAASSLLHRRNTFSNFGSGFAILINASNVIFDGMGAILDGGGHTEYGIIVNNQNATSYNIFSSNPGDALGGISITNITLTGFTQAGIFFNNVIGDLPGCDCFEYHGKCSSWQQRGGL